jgi:hypothetical protein
MRSSGSGIFRIGLCDAFVTFPPIILHLPSFSPYGTKSDRPLRDKIRQATRRFDERGEQGNGKFLKLGRNFLKPPLRKSLVEGGNTSNPFGAEHPS